MSALEFNNTQLEKIELIKETNEVNIKIKLNKELDISKAWSTTSRETTSTGIRNVFHYNLSSYKTLEPFNQMILKKVDEVLNDNEFNINLNIKKCTRKDSVIDTVMYKIKKLDFKNKEGQEIKIVNINLFLYKAKE